MNLFCYYLYPMIENMDSSLRLMIVVSIIFLILFSIFLFRIKVKKEDINELDNRIENDDLENSDPIDIEETLTVLNDFKIKWYLYVADYVNTKKNKEIVEYLCSLDDEMRSFIDDCVQKALASYPYRYTEIDHSSPSAIKDKLIKIKEYEHIKEQTMNNLSNGKISKFQTTLTTIWWQWGIWWFILTILGIVLAWYGYSDKNDLLMGLWLWIAIYIIILTRFKSETEDTSDMIARAYYEIHWELNEDPPIDISDNDILTNSEIDFIIYKVIKVLVYFNNFIVGVLGIILLYYLLTKLLEWVTVTTILLVIIAIWVRRIADKR